MLTGDEVAEILDIAVREKRGRLARIEYQKKISEPVSYPACTAEQLYTHKMEVAAQWSEARTHGFSPHRDFATDAANERVIKLLCLYFTADPRFERMLGDLAGLSLQKGIFLTGPAGCGKTTLMRLFAENQEQSYFVETAIEVTAEFESEGQLDILNHYASMPVRPRNGFGHREYAFCFDDLGAETVGTHFGGKSWILERILYMRNEKGFPTHATSNLSPGELCALYKSARLESRMKSMFNIIALPGGDRRK